MSVSFTKMLFYNTGCNVSVGRSVLTFCKKVDSNCTHCFYIIGVHNTAVGNGMCWKHSTIKIGLLIMAFSTL